MGQSQQLAKCAMSLKTLSSYFYYFAALATKFILFYSLNMMMPTMKTTEDPAAVVMETETEELPTYESQHGPGRCSGGCPWSLGQCCTNRCCNETCSVM